MTDPDTPRTTAPAMECDALTEEQIAEIRAWAASPEGQRKIREAMEHARAVIAELERARRIDPARLREPVTI
jgi:mono/diheme cytochrome c family protein